MTKSPIFITIIMIRKFYIAVMFMCIFWLDCLSFFFFISTFFLAKYYDIFFWVQIPYICIWNCKNFHNNKIHILFNLVIKQEKSICDQIWFNWKSGSFSYMRHIVCRIIIQAERVTEIETCLGLILFLVLCKISWYRWTCLSLWENVQS